MTKKTHTNKIQCGEHELAAIKKLKDALCHATQNPMYIIDPSRGFNLLVDASSHTVAGVLTQTTDDGIRVLPIRVKLPMSDVPIFRRKNSNVRCLVVLSCFNRRGGRWSITANDR